jgi:hypothetical protein
MTEMTPREVILAFFEDLNAGRAETAFARLDPDVEYRVMAAAPHGGTVDAQGLAAKAYAVFEKLSAPLQTKVGLVLADGEYVVVEVTGNGQTKRGGNYDNHYLFLYRVVGGMIVEAREFLDSAKYAALMEDRL